MHSLIPPKEAAVPPLTDDAPRPDSETAQTSWGGRLTGNEDLTMIDFVPSDQTAITPVSFEGPPTFDEIAAEAYAIYESRGGEDGRDQDDWHEAERRLRARRNEASNE